MSQFELYILEAFGLLVAFVSPRALGGAEGDRTPDLDIANVALSQLSYGPMSGVGPARAERGG